MNNSHFRTARSALFTSLALLTACGAEDFPVDEATTPDLGQSEAAISTCGGTDDANALTASLAVAIANELGRWDVSTDFAVVNGKLELSATGRLHCGTGCATISALLRMQDDAASIVVNHSPSNYRTRLTTWYAQQKQQLTNMVDQMLHVDEGVYRVRSKLSGKYLVPQAGSTSSGAIIQQSDQYNSSTASQWRVILQGTRQQLINVRSGLCLDLQTNTSSLTYVVQRACSGASTQGFQLAEEGAGLLSLRTATARALAIQNSSSFNGASLVQDVVKGTSVEQFVFEPYGSGTHRDLLETATAVYSLKVAHTGMAVAVSSSSLSNGISVVQQPYSSTDDRFHWYVTQVGSGTVNGVVQTTYQFINRRTGKCLDLTSSTPSRLVQNTCSTAWTQRFMLTPTGDGHQVAYTVHGVTMGVQSGSTLSGAQLVEGGGTWQPYNMLTFGPVLAGEPHRLTYSHETLDGPCGKYDWFDITQPNGLPLDDPADSYVQLIFAGGKQSPTGIDVNPFISQQVSGDQVAIDPTLGLVDEGTTSTGSCSTGCVKISSQASLLGQCCSCNGVTKAFKRALWNASTYLCL